MRYLITTIDSKPILTNWFNPTNFINEMVVYDLLNQTYSNNGLNWFSIEVDELH